MANHRRILIAPDAFKGTLTAEQAAAAIARGAGGAGLEAVSCPVADGGEGTIEVLLGRLPGELRSSPCSDPLGRRIEADWAWLPAQRTAIVEMAGASGLALLDPGELDAERATSAGTGELLLAAARAGAQEAILAIGGTATTDGGIGALEAIAAGGGIGAMRLTLACDVNIPFERAAEVFGPQKGASPQAVERLTERLMQIARKLPRDPRGMPMSGAGGGLAGGLWAVHGAVLTGGAALVMETLEFDRLLAEADAVVVGEGRLDGQSRHGKITGAILDRALEREVPVHAIVGSWDQASVEREWQALSSLQPARTPAELEAAGARLAEL